MLSGIQRLAEHGCTQDSFVVIPMKCQPPQSLFLSLNSHSPGHFHSFNKQHSLAVVKKGVWSQTVLYCVSSGQLLNISEPWFIRLNNGSLLLRWLCGMNVLIH